MPRMWAVPDHPDACDRHHGPMRPLWHDAAPNRPLSLEHNIALTLAALVLLAIMCTTTLMDVETAAIRLTAGLFSGPAALVRRGMGELAAAIVFVTVLAPFSNWPARSAGAAPSASRLRLRRETTSLVDDRSLRIRSPM
jgi:hypothetical protein